MSRYKKPDVSVTVGGYDCTGVGDWTAKELRLIGRIFLAAALAIEEKKHGALESKGGGKLVHVGIDFGGPFDDETGLPRLNLNYWLDRSLLQECRDELDDL